MVLTRGDVIRAPPVVIVRYSRGIHGSAIKRIAGAIMETNSVESPPRMGMNIAFKDLNYSVPHRKEKGTMAYLLTNVTGYLNPGEMTALMGPSGSGKSTLLDVLAGRKTQGTIDGTVLFSANKATTTFIRRFTGYVEQFDTLIGNLTVQEMLQYTAELKRPISEPLSRKKEEVRRLIKKLALEKCRDTKIGTALSRGISGGQAKRVNIGIALVTDPKILFLDEPTSGLDSATSNEVIRVVKLLATEDNVTVCATIHSPSMKAFRLFDRVMMLVKGQVTFFGRRVDAVPYFETLGSDTSIDDAENEAEWLIDIVVKADLEGKASQLAQQFDQSELKKSVIEMVEHNLNDPRELDEQTKAALAVKKETVAPSWSALRTLIKFRTWSNLRSAEYILGRTGDKIVVMIIVAILFSDIGDNPQRDFIDISALLFVWVIFPAFGATAYIPEIVQERALFYRERNDGLYRVIVYLISKMIDETAVAFVTSLVLGAILWAATGIDASYIIFAMAYFGVLMNGIMCGYLFGAVSPNLSVANAALPGYLSTTIFLTGFFIRTENIPAWIRWYSKLSFPFYAWNALMSEEFPDADEPDNIYVATGLDERRTILDYYNITRTTGFYMAWVYVFAGVYFVLTFLAMTFIRYQRR